MSESGQSAVILALMFMMLLAFVGLATDTGIMYVAYGQLRRAVDAASLGAASQLREARSITDTTEMAKQYIQLQGLVLNNIDVDTCDSIATEQGVPLPTSVAAAQALDPIVCSYPPRKLVRVRAAIDVQFAFMQLFWWHSITLNTEAVSEAAALEIILVVDTSASMAEDASGGGTTGSNVGAANTTDDDGDTCVDEAAGAGCDANSKDDGWLRAFASPTGLPPTLDFTRICAGKDPHTTIALGGSDIYGDWRNPPTNTLKLLPTDLTVPASKIAVGDPAISGVVSPVHSCRPFEWVRDAAMRFVLNFVKFPYDRVGIVQFAGSYHNPSGTTPPGWTAFPSNGIATTRVVQGLGDTVPLTGQIKASSLSYTISALQTVEVSPSPPCHGSFPSKDTIFPNRLQYTTGAFGACEATDTGTAIKLAMDDLNLNGRQNALRFIILLSDGAVSTSSPTAYNGNYYACPYHIYTDGSDPAPSLYVDWNIFQNRRCQDGDGRTAGVNNSRHLSTSNLYDADDFARDKADTINPLGTTTPTIVFVIGLGNAVIVNPGTGGTQPACNASLPAGTVDYNTDYNPDPGITTMCNPDQKPDGEQLLRYIADAGDGVVNDTFSCNRDSEGLYQATIGSNCGNYYYAQGADVLDKIFTDIAQRIFTKITR
jgi:hypothetical protein